MSTPEGKVKKRVLNIYRDTGAKYDRAAATGMGKNGRADDVVRRAPDGHFVGVELKKEDVFVVTKLQRIWLQDNSAGGGSSLVINMTNLDLLENTLRAPGSQVIAAFEDLKNGARCTGHTVCHAGKRTWIPAKPPEKS